MTAGVDYAKANEEAMAVLLHGDVKPSQTENATTIEVDIASDEADDFANTLTRAYWALGE